jgi:branched-chain amino acid transport system ATP-binding protein
LGAEPLLEIQGIDSGYGKIQILFDVSLRVERGEIITVVGPNGAGKSTALKTAMVYLKPTKGHIVFDDNDITGKAVHEIVTAGIGYVRKGASRSTG